ncbi:MAG: tetrathionate reductase family octaheme c-type cytochrome [Thiobacillus sp.]|nr:tetrathionate reductase family octaheme c-type cytochrome [Thiobacillus sp.]
MRAKHLLLLSLFAGATALTALAATDPAAKAVSPVEPSPDYPKMTMPAPEVKPPVKKDSKSTADHSKFKELQVDFKTGPEVTAACLKCHTEAAKQVQHTAHWTWEYLNPQTNQQLGKKNIINNFCTSISTNQEFCTACHVGYGWKDQSFDFTKQDNVDCLVCHESTNTYRKLPGWAGNPVYQDVEFPPGSGKIVKAVDLKASAQSVGKTGRKNCGACHFYGGGGDAVKHGDLDSSMTNPSRYLDVHMDKDGLNFSCGECHKTTGHQVPGSRYNPTAKDDSTHMRGKEDNKPETCQACHTAAPHKHNVKLNTHAEKIACQTCHIPEYARGGKPTKMSWDWSTAGKLDKDGKPFKLKDSAGHDSYDSKKGDFVYEDNVIPEYIWFNGKVDYTLRETKLDPTKVVRINTFEGSPTDGNSKIWPIKVFTGKQPYDKATNQLLIPHTFGGEGDDTAFWRVFDWKKALEAGMKSVNESFSGEYGFVSTEMSWPITHMVAPKGDALKCEQCHQPSIGVGRLDTVPGIYMPGRSANKLIDMAGWSIALLSLLGVLAHGAGRYYAAKKGAHK